MFCHHRLRMKLDSLDGKLTMSQSHHQSIRCSGRDLQVIRYAVLFDYQGVIPRRFESIGNPSKNRSRIMTYLAYLSVHQVRRANHSSTKRFTDRLMPKANSQNWDLGRKRADYFDG